MYACLLNLLTMASVNVCRLCTNAVNLLSRAGMRNEFFSRICAVLDITITDERVCSYVC